MAALPPFQAVIDAYSADVHRFLIFLVGPQEADDCFQETFLAALKSYPKLRSDSNLRAWLLTVARSKAMDRFRKQKRSPELRDPLDHENDVAALDSQEPRLDEGVWLHVRELPEKQRLAVAYRYAGDLSYEDIASVLDCSEDAARQSVSTGLKRLREVMKNA